MADSNQATLMDRNGRAVHAFSIEMANLGFERMAEHIVAMLDNEAWRDWKDGLGRVELLPGEYDYFLSMCNVSRETIMHGIRDIGVKARLQQAMDERRGGEDGYRRPYQHVRAALGEHRKAMPFGYTQAEAKELVEEDEGVALRHREALGDGVRRYVKTGSASKPTVQRTRLEQVRALIEKLDEHELSELAGWLTERRSSVGSDSAAG